MTQPDQSVEDILASIKRIIVEEDAARPAPEPDVLELDRPLPPEPEAAPPPPLPPSFAEPRPAPARLVSAGTADASRQALSYLSSLKLHSGEPADDTLNGLVRELLKPMLKAWLDAELPAIVERLVVQEIARLTDR